MVDLKDKIQDFIKRHPTDSEVERFVGQHGYTNVKRALSALLNDVNTQLGQEKLKDEPDRHWRRKAMGFKQAVENALAAAKLAAPRKIEERHLLPKKKEKQLEILSELLSVMTDIHDLIVDIHEETVVSSSYEGLPGRQEAEA